MLARPILLIEDNPDDVELTRRAFRRANIINDLVVATDGDQALEFLHGTNHSPSQYPVPAVILLDLKLPRVSGFDVLKRIRSDERTRNVPVIILTSSRDDADLRNSYQYGVNSFVRKPVDMDDFVKVVQQVGMYWLAVNEAAADMQTPDLDNLER